MSMPRAVAGPVPPAAVFVTPPAIRLSRNANIQILRAIAALGVVWHHSMHALSDTLSPGRFVWNSSFGAYGVMLFFVISGYIMMMVTARKEKTVRSFLSARLIRILPLYYLLTAVIIVMKITGIAHFGKDPVTAIWALKSFLFLPFTKTDTPSDPILFPGWTLNYEMMFYMLFACFLAVRKEALRAQLVIAAILAVYTLALIWPTPLMRYFGSDLILGFAFGVALWPLTQRITLGWRAASTLIILGFAVLLAIDANGLNATPHIAAVLSLAAAAIVAGAIFLEKQGLSWRNRWAVGLGDASYALYLIHPLMIALVASLAVKAHLNDSTAGLSLSVAAMLILSLIAAALLYRLVDSPLQDRLKRWKPVAVKANRRQAEVCD